MTFVEPPAAAVSRPTAPPPADGARRREHVPGEVGLWVFLLGDMAMFALFFCIIEVTRGQQTQMFQASQRLLHPDLAVVNTLLLVTGSWLVASGLAAMRRGRGRPVLLLLAATGCAVGFATIKSVEYALLVGDGHTATENDFFMYYFVFTGIHLAHLAIASGFLVTMLLLARRPGELTAGRIRLAECGACVWHLVDLLWLVLFPLLYVVR